MKQILKYYVRIFSLLFPLFFLPIMLDPYGAGKVWFLMIGGFIGLVLWIVNMLIEGKGIIKFNKYFWLATVFTIWSVIGWYGTKMPLGARMASFMSPFGVGMSLSLLICMFLWIQISDKNEFKVQVNCMAIGGVILAILSLVVFLLPNSRLPINLPSKDNPLLSIGQGWSLTGSVFGETILFLVLGIEFLKRLLGKLKKKEKYIIEAIMTAVFGLALFLGIFKIITFGWVSLDFFSSWNIAVETLKGNIIKGSTIFGVGAGNFATAFNLFRPASYNLTKYWSSAFGLSSMGLLHVWTEMGLVGLLLMVWGILGMITRIKEKDTWQILIVAAVAIFLPLNPIVLFVLFWLLAYKSDETRESKMILYVGEKNFNVLPYLLALLMLAGIALGGFWQGKAMLADFTMRQSLLAAAKNDGTGTYNLQIKAVNINPYLSSYRRLFSQTNLAIAANILQKKDLTDADKQQASSLIQQAVDQGKQSIALNGLESSNWVNLAVTYKQLIGVVDGTADWSFQAYQQATILDPINPLTRLDLGGLLFAAQRYEDAGRTFEQVVKDKPDFANAWYNLAYADKAQNKLDVAVADLQQAVSLVPKDSGDFEKANKELDTWKKELEEAIKRQKAAVEAQKVKTPETLKAPVVAPTPAVGAEEKVNVPAEQIQPPEAPVLPTAEPTSEALPQ